MTETTLQSIQFVRSDRSCRLPRERLQGVLEDAMVTGWLDGADREVRRNAFFVCFLLLVLLVRRFLSVLCALGSVFRLPFRARKLSRKRRGKGQLTRTCQQVCVAVGTVDGSIFVLKPSFGERVFTELSGIGW